MCTSFTIGVTIGFAFFGSAAVTLFCTTCVEKSASVAFVGRWSTMTGFRASGAIVATYWSVLVTVRMAQTEITETGIKRATPARRAPTAMIRSCPAAPDAASSLGNRRSPPPARTSSGAGPSALFGVHVCSSGHAHTAMPSAKAALVRTHRQGVRLVGVEAGGTDRGDSALSL